MNPLEAPQIQIHITQGKIWPLNNFVSSKFVMHVKPSPPTASGHISWDPAPFPFATLSVRRAISTFWKNSAFFSINTTREVNHACVKEILPNARWNAHQSASGSHTRYLEAVEQSMLHFALERVSTEAHEQQKNAGLVILRGASLQDFPGPSTVLAA